MATLFPPSGQQIVISDGRPTRVMALWMQQVSQELGIVIPVPVPGPPSIIVIDEGSGGSGGGDGEQGPPGPVGPTGATGATGPEGAAGIAAQDGADGEDALMIPGSQGPQGNDGATGPAGPIGIGLDGDQGDDGMAIPGPVGPAGTSGAWTQLSQIVTSGSQATVDFTSISGSYNSLKVLWFCQDTQAGTSSVTLRLQINADATSGNYTALGRVEASNASSIVSTIAASAKGSMVGLSPQAGNTSITGSGEVTLVGYAGITFHKRINVQFGGDDGTSNITLGVGTWRWKSTAAITRLTFGTDGTAFTDGSIFTLYGVL